MCVLNVLSFFLNKIFICVEEKTNKRKNTKIILTDTEYERKLSENSDVGPDDDVTMKKNKSFKMDALFLLHENAKHVEPSWTFIQFCYLALFFLMFLSVIDFCC